MLRYDCIFAFMLLFITITSLPEVPKAIISTSPQTQTRCKLSVHGDTWLYLGSDCASDNIATAEAGQEKEQAEYLKITF